MRPAACEIPHVCLFSLAVAAQDGLGVCDAAKTLWPVPVSLLCLPMMFLGGVCCVSLSFLSLPPSIVKVAIVLLSFRLIVGFLSFFTHFPC